MDDLTLRTSFDREAARYQRARPAPPEKLIDAMCEQGRLEPGTRILEVGCGTGQTTRPLAERGLNIHALELGPAVAGLARVNLEVAVTVETIAFEDYRSATPFDALVSVQAFHWLEPRSGLAYAASLLHPGGTLLLAWHQDHSRTTPFYQATDPVHKRYEALLNLKRPTPNDAPERFTEALKTSSDFGAAQISRYAWTHLYSEERYLDLLQTYSNVQAMKPATRKCFLAAMTTVIDAYGGQVERLYESVLLSATRLA